eukprot:jgi/Mesvir1/20480/Mv12367-RA.1
MREKRSDATRRFRASVQLPLGARAKFDFFSYQLVSAMVGIMAAEDSSVYDKQGVEEQTVYDPAEGARLMRPWIMNALEKKKQGDPRFYDELVQSLEESQFEQLRFQVMLDSLCSCIPYMSPCHHEALLTKILGLSVWKCDEAVAATLLRFVEHMVCAITSTVQQALELVVRNYLPPHFVRLPAGVDADQVIEERKACMMDMLLRTACSIIELVPTSTSRLLPIIITRMPHKRHPKKQHIFFLENVIRLAESRQGAVLREDLLIVIVERLLDMDVEIKWEDILMEEEVDAENMVFPVDISDDPGEEEEEPAEEQDREMFRSLEGRSGKVKTDEMVDKLDALMDLTFDHIGRRHARGETAQVFETLLRVFDVTILNTYRSKFTQFLLFYTCSLSPDRASLAFVRYLSDKLLHAGHPRTTRIAAVAYLGSFLARAKFLSLDVIMDAITQLVGWCSSYVRIALRTRGDGSPAHGRGNGASYATVAATGPGAVRRPNPDASDLLDVGAHGVFYAAWQAVMYSLCYHMRRLAEYPPTAPRLRQLPLMSLLECPLNPLKFCLSYIVREFAAQAADLGIARCQHIVEANKSVVVHSETTFGGANHLDMLFPFDPYLLRYSSRHIQQQFEHWRAHGQAGQPYDDDDQEEEEEDASSDGDDDEDSDDDEGEDYREDAGGRMNGHGVAANGVGVGSAGQRNGHPRPPKGRSIPVGILTKSHHMPMTDGTAVNGRPSYRDIAVAAAGSGGSSWGAAMGGTPDSMQGAGSLLGTSFTPMSCTPPTAMVLPQLPTFRG